MKRFIKRFLYLLLLTPMTLLVLAICFFFALDLADEMRPGGCEYVLKGDGTAAITGYSGKGADLTIPETLGGVPVSEICDGAFAQCQGLTSVAIPEGVVRVGSNPFRGCGDLILRLAPDHPSFALAGGALVEKASGRLICCPPALGLAAYKIPQGVRSIGDEAFWGCWGLTSVTIPDSVTSIGEGAFEGCRSLSSLAIPDSVTSIGEGAFEGCESLTLTVGRGSFAQRYAADHFLPCACTGDPQDG